MISEAEDTDSEMSQNAKQRNEKITRNRSRSSCSHGIFMSQDALKHHIHVALLSLAAGNLHQLPEVCEAPVIRRGRLRQAL